MSASEEIENLAQRLFAAAYGAVAGELDLEGDDLEKWGESVARDAFVLARAFVAERWIQQKLGRQA